MNIRSELDRLEALAEELGPQSAADTIGDIRFARDLLDETERGELSFEEAADAALRRVNTALPGPAQDALQAVAYG